MACQVIIHSWTFCGLVGAFLDLAITCLLLCCSTIAFLVDKSLGFFGLSLPCPCNGLFGYPNRAPCVQRLLVDRPTETISSVQLSVKTKFPFDSILARNWNDHRQLNLKLVRERKLDDGGIELEGEASYSSFSDSIGKFDHLKGKGSTTTTTTTTTTQRQRCGLRRRRRGSVDYGKITSGSSYDHMRSDVRVVHRSPSDPSKIGRELHGDITTTPINFNDDKDRSTVPGRTAPDFESNDATDGSKPIYDSATILGDLKNNVGYGHGVDGQEENVVRILEQALEEEQAARAALCSELEQERIAAATAADEAMAMISRVQEEKASIEIEARQYQRILEEKSAYDAEEMNILKEIIVRREREKHFLEKELEFYRKVLQENDILETQGNDVQGGQNEAPFLNSSMDDPMLMLQQLSESIDRQGNLQNKASPSVEKQTCPVSLEWDDETEIVKGFESPNYSSIIQDDLHNGATPDIQEKGILSIDDITHPQLCNSSCPPKHDFLEKNTILVGGGVQNDNVYQQQKMIPGVVKSDDRNEMQMQVGETDFHDVHIMDSKCDVCSKSSATRSGPPLMHNNASNVATKCEHPFKASNFQQVDDSADNSLRVELDINRSSSDVVHRYPSVSSSPSRTFVSELRRNSLSAVDYERLKIDSEIGWLRERLRTVQEEKEKLKNSLERRESGKNELQLLEDIAAQIREIQHLTEPEKAARQPSLPPVSSKVTSKKRRSRSISIGAGQNSST